MGAFHEGHLSLMRKAKEVSDVSVVSIFVNPLQFGENEDLSKYPRNEEQDFALAQSVAVDVVFAPSVDELIGCNSTVVHVTGVSELWEGETRPGHFDGVATIVCKLFNIIGACSSIFGLKDYQQCAVIRQLVSDLNLPINLIFEETVREPDGLAMSSRNSYLSSSEREVATQLYRSLLDARNRILLNTSNESIGQVLLASRQEISDAGFNIDYFAFVDAETLQPKVAIGGSGRLIAAAKLGRTRLIDNIGV
jgi:pantoate--beta-alanine ligase